MDDRNDSDAGQNAAEKRINANLNKNRSSPGLGKNGSGVPQVRKEKGWGGRQNAKARNPGAGPGPRIAVRHQKWITALPR